MAEEQVPIDAARLRAEADRLERELGETARSILWRGAAAGEGSSDRMELETLSALRQGNWYGDTDTAERNPFGAAADATRVINQVRENEQSMARIRERTEAVVANGLGQVKELRDAADALDRGDQIDQDHLHTLLSPATG